MSRREFLIVSAIAGAGAGLTGDWRRPGAASDRVRVGVVGVGARGRRHLAGYDSVPGVEVVALCDLDARRLRGVEALAAGPGGRPPALYTDWRRMLDRESLDALSVVTPHPAQTEIALAACAAGADVLLDRPQKNLEALVRLGDAAREGGRLAGQIYNAQFVGAADARSAIPLETLDQLSVARARREVSATDAVAAGCGDGCEMLLLAPVEEFDYARGVLGVHSLRSVSCVALRGAGRGEVVRAGLHYEFEAAGSLKTVELEAVSAPALSQTPAGNGAADAGFGAAGGVGLISFSGVRAAFTVRSGQGEEFGRIGLPGAWHNFVGCVRSRRPADLMAPLSELTASLEMLRLAKMSMESGRVTMFSRNDAGATQAGKGRA